MKDHTLVPSLAKDVVYCNPKLPRSDWDFIKSMRSLIQVFNQDFVLVHYVINWFLYDWECGEGDVSSLNHPFKYNVYK